MREFDRPVAAALSVVCLAAAIAIAFAGDALAQANQAPPNQTAPAPQAAPPQQPTVKPVKQMALTDKQIEGVLAAQKDMEEITAKLDGVARKNGFASYDEYTNVVGNISIVLAGFDPATKQVLMPSSRRRLRKLRPTRKCRPATRRKHLPS